MSQVKVSEATGAVLDWMVAKCAYTGADSERVFLYHTGFDFAKHTVRVANQDTCTRDRSFEWEPSIDWEQGGPIIEQEKINIFNSGSLWFADMKDERDCDEQGVTPLIAAMRRYVASKLGDTVEVPGELA